MVYFNLNKSEFTEEKQKEYEKLSIEEMGIEDGKGFLRIQDDSVKGKISDWEEECIIVDIESPIGFISLEVRFDSEDLYKLIEIAVKKLNKFKTLLESVK
ncbi:MAG: hypothetical protein AABY22_28640 [Nanoarchaeota archaeon]